MILISEISEMFRKGVCKAHLNSKKCRLLDYEFRYALQIQLRTCVAGKKKRQSVYL